MASFHSNCQGCKALQQYLPGPIAIAEITALETMRHSKKLKKHEFLFQDGDQPEGIYCICSGSFKLSKAGPEGDEHILSMALPGSLLGLRAMVTQEPYSVSAQAREDSTACYFESSRFKQFLEKAPGLTGAVLTQLGRQLREAREDLLERSAASAPARLAHCLLQLEQLYAPFQRAIRVSGHELACMIGVAPETISRMLGRFEAKGLLKHRGREIQILDKTALREMEEDPEAAERLKKNPGPQDPRRRRQGKVQSRGKATAPKAPAADGVKTPLVYL